MEQVLLVALLAAQRALVVLPVPARDARPAVQMPAQRGGGSPHRLQT